MDLGFYIGIYFIFILEGLITIFALFVPSYLKWVVNPRKCAKIFANQINFSKISFVVQGRKFLYLSFYGFSLIMYSFFTFVVPYLVWLMLGAEYHYWKFAIPLIVAYLLFQFLLLFTLWKLWKKISIDMPSKKKAVENFLDFQKEWITKNVLKTEVFSIEVSNRVLSLDNQAFQHHQKKLMKSLNKLQQKDLSPELFNFKVLQIFLFYLEKNTWQFKHLEGQKTQYKIWIDHQSAKLNELKIVIINNFFSFEQEFQSLKNNL